jgi:hypothetical protein
MLVSKRLLSLCSKKLPGKLNFLLRNSSFIPIEHSYYQYFVSVVLSFAFPCAILLRSASTIGAVTPLLSKNSVAPSRNCSYGTRPNKRDRGQTVDDLDGLMTNGGRFVAESDRNVSSATVSPQIRQVGRESGNWRKNRMSGLESVK